MASDMYPDDIDPASGCRLPLPRRKELSPEAQQAYDRIAAPGSGNLRGLRGPGGIQLHSPELSRHARPLNRYLRFDSGLGGLTVLREIVKVRPDAHYVYIADDVFFPYGHHSEAEIVARVVPLVGEFIAAHEPDLVVIACNTMSVSVMAPLRAVYDVPFVGTVPAIKPA